MNNFETTVYDERELFDLLADNIEIMTDEEKLIVVEVYNKQGIDGVKEVLRDQNEEEDAYTEHHQLELKSKIKQDCFAEFKKNMEYLNP